MVASDSINNINDMHFSGASKFRVVMASHLVAVTNPRPPREGSMSSAPSTPDLPRDMVSKFRNSGPKSRAFFSNVSGMLAF